MAEVQELGASEIETWRIYFRDDPQGTDRTDILAAHLGTAILNMLRRDPRRTRAFKPHDWMPPYGRFRFQAPVRPKATPEQVMGVMTALEAMGMVVRKEAPS